MMSILSHMGEPKAYEDEIPAELERFFENITVGEVQVIVLNDYINLQAALDTLEHAPSEEPKTFSQIGRNIAVHTANYMALSDIRRERSNKEVTIPEYGFYMEGLISVIDGIISRKIVPNKQDLLQILRQIRSEIIDTPSLR